MIIKNNKGFTLVELLVALGILSMVLLPLTMTVTTGYRTFYVQEENIDVMQNGRFALDRITNKIRKANPEDLEVSNNTLKVDNYTYYKQGTQLMEKINNTSNDIARYIETFFITKNDNSQGQIKSIDITIILKSQRSKDYTLKTTVYIRNR